MPPRTAQEKAERKLRLEEKREARRLAKLKKEQECKASESVNEVVTSTETTTTSDNGGDGHARLLELPDFALHHIICFLPARDVGCLTLTSKLFCLDLVAARVPYVISRLYRPHQPLRGAVGFADFCSNEEQARTLLKQSYGGGDTRRCVVKGKFAKECTNEFVSYARFLEESICGYATQGYGGKEPTPLPPFVHGRFVSVSPEHSISRVGGDGTLCGGGSGVATWGVGKRGQLGHGRREDEHEPRMLLGGIGYGIRIVQVSAGGGLVRVAHSLLLTSTGRVLSFGTGQYGALGHGFSGGKQLPDALRPKYIDALAGVRCMCVSAGELHSAVVTVDGDVYTWGDGFCGQLGHGDKRPQPAPVHVTHGGLEDECVSSVSCGARHTLAITEDGDVFSWGLGHFGVLGRSFTPFDHDPDTAVIAMGRQGLIGGGGEDGINPAVPLPLAGAAPAAAGEDAVNGAAEERRFADELLAHLDMLANLSLTDSSDQCIPKLIDSLQGIKIVGASAGHRHTLLLDEMGALYSCGAGASGCLGHGDHQSQMVPMRIKDFDESNIRIMQMSAGVDMSMAVTTTGDVYGWGKTDRGRIGLGLQNQLVNAPRKVVMKNGDRPVKAIDVDCGYVHSVVVGLDGTIHLCGGVGVDGANDGEAGCPGIPTQINDFNIWHRVPEPRDNVKKDRWKKYGKYEVKGRSKMMNEDV